MLKMLKGGKIIVGCGNKGTAHPGTGHEGPRRGSRGIALLFL